MMQSQNMSEIQDNLRCLWKFFPGEQEIIYLFGRTLAEYLNPQLTPEGFLLAIELCLLDGAAGKCGFPNKNVEHKYFGYDPSIYELIRSFYVDRIIKAVCPEDFANAVFQVKKEMIEELKGK